MILALTVSVPLSWLECVEGSGGAGAGSGTGEVDAPEVVLSKVRYKGVEVLALEPLGRRGN